MTLLTWFLKAFIVILILSLAVGFSAIFPEQTTFFATGFKYVIFLALFFFFVFPHIQDLFGIRITREDKNHKDSTDA